MIALATDEGFAMPTAVAVRSAVEAIGRGHGRDLQVHVVGVDLSDASWAGLEGAAVGPGVSFHPILGDAGRFAHLPDAPVITRTAYWRILLPELLPDVDRVLYLDGDILVRRDPGPLYDIDLQGASSAGVRDYLWWYTSTAGGIPGDHGLPPFAPYVNTGVLLMSLERWRAEEIGSRIQAFRAATPDARELDQDAINVALHDDIQLADLRWNVQTPAFHARWPRLAHREEPPSPFPWTAVDDVRRDPWIVHFTTDRKPWRPACPNPMQAEWLDVLSRTAWADFQPDVAPSVTRLVRRARREAGLLAYRYALAPGILLAQDWLESNPFTN